MEDVVVALVLLPPVVVPFVEELVVPVGAAPGVMVATVVWTTVVTCLSLFTLRKEVTSVVTWTLWLPPPLLLCCCH